MHTNNIIEKLKLNFKENEKSTTNIMTFFFYQNKYMT